MTLRGHQTGELGGVNLANIAEMFGYSDDPFSVLYQQLTGASVTCCEMRLDFVRYEALVIRSDQVYRHQAITVGRMFRQRTFELPFGLYPRYGVDSIVGTQFLAASRPVDSARLSEQARSHPPIASMSQGVCRCTLSPEKSAPPPT